MAKKKTKQVEQGKQAGARQQGISPAVNIAADKLAANVVQPSLKARVLLLLARPHKILVVWVLALISIAILFGFSAATERSLASGTQVVLTLDHAPVLQDIKDSLGAAEISYDAVEIEAGSQVTIYSQDSEENLKKFRDSLTAAQYVSKEVYTLTPLNLPTQHLPALASTSILFAILSFLGVLIGLRSQSLNSRLKIWSLLLLIPILIGLVVSAFAVVVSKLGFIALNPALFELYTSGIVMCILVWTYLLCRLDTRQSLLKFFFRA